MGGQAVHLHHETIFEAPSRAACQLVELELCWEMVAVEGQQRLVASPPLVGVEVTDGTNAMRIESVREEDTRFRVAVLVTPAVRLDVPLEIYVHQCQVGAADQGGRQLRCTSQTGTGVPGGVRLLALFERSPDSDLETVEVTLPARCDRREIKFAFTDLPISAAAK